MNYIKNGEGFITKIYQLIYIPGFILYLSFFLFALFIVLCIIAELRDESNILIIGLIALVISLLLFAREGGGFLNAKDTFYIEIDSIYIGKIMHMGSISKLPFRNGDKVIYYYKSNELGEKTIVEIISSE